MARPLTDHSQPSAREAAAASPDGGPPEGGSARSRRRARLAAVAAIALALAGAVVLALRSGAPKHNSAGTGVPRGETTTTVERRTLVERSSVDGTLTYSGASELYDRLAGTFTWLPSVGAVIGRGGTLWRIDNLPVVLMYGSLPAYRALKQGVSNGPDVSELNANLIDLGFDPYGAIGENEQFSEATAAAVRRWQKAEGLAQTGEVELGRVMFAPGARRVTVVHVALGDDPPGSGAKEPAPANHNKSKESEQERAAKERGEREQAAKDRAAKAKAAQEDPKSKEGEQGSKEASEKEKGGKEPGGSGAAAPVLALGTTSTRQIVQLQVKADQQELAHLGEAAPVTLPSGNVVQGQITEVGTVASEASESEKKAALPALAAPAPATAKTPPSP